MPADVDVAAGQVWRHRRDGYRKVTIVEVVTEGSAWRFPDGKLEDPFAHVTRNTSRRKQSILLRTLRRDYRLYSGATLGETLRVRAEEADDAR